MLTPQDDLIGHQTTTTFDHVASSDPAWMERLWYTGHPAPDGDVIFDIGLGFHPNRNVMDVFAGVEAGGIQTNYRASRHARPNPLDTSVGALSIKVLEGLKRHHLSLADNPSGLTFDLEFVATMNPHEEEPHFRRRKGRVTEDMTRVQQLGRYQGWMALDDRRWDIDQKTWLGQRDHSWGIRAEMRTDDAHPPVTFYPPFLFLWITVQFEDYGLQLFLKERAPGDTIYISGEVVRPLGDRTRSPRLVALTHDIDWLDDPRGQTVRAATLEAIFSDGSRRTIHVRTLPARYYLKGGLYGGLNGWFHGDDKGRLYAEADRWDLSVDAVRAQARTLSDHVIEVRDGDQTGWGIMEYGVGSGYARYEAVQAHPPI